MPIGVKVSDTMRKSVITVSPEDTCEKALKFMVNLDIGSVIVTEKHTPIGIVTDSNLLERVFSKKKDPASVKIKDVMSHPIRTIDPGLDLEDAMKIMRDLSIKRLPVVKNKRLVGLITETDLVQVSPALFEIVAEAAELRGGYAPSKDIYSGICEKCGSYSEALFLHNDLLICPDCKESD